MPTTPSRITLSLAALVTAATLAGCGGPEGLGTVDADAARQEINARATPDARGRAPQSRIKVASRGPRRPSPAYAYRPR